MNKQRWQEICKAVGFYDGDWMSWMLLGDPTLGPKRRKGLIKDTVRKANRKNIPLQELKKWIYECRRWDEYFDWPPYKPIDPNAEAINLDDCLR